MLVVRRATVRDAAAISSLLSELGYELDDRQVRFELDAQPGTNAWLAVDGAEPVGVVVTNTRRHLHRAAVVTSIDALVVTSGRRSAGIGTRLLATVAEHARRAGAQMIDLHSASRRIDARRFYEREGFVVTSNYFVRRP
jgi:PhnO protein